VLAQLQWDDGCYTGNMRGSEWSGLCGVPGIGTSVRNSYKEPCYVWDIKQEMVPDEKIRSKLLKIFKSKKWKKNTKEAKLKSPFTLPKLKIIKDDRQISSGLQYDWKSSEFSPDFLDIHRALVRRTKSCPMEKPPTVWFNLHDFQGPDTQPCKNKVSVGTQTEWSLQDWLEMCEGNANNRRLRQVNFSKQIINNRHLDLSDIEKEFMNTEFENECNKEVIQALSKKPQDKWDDISKQRQLQTASITTSEIISPTLIMETELDTDTDTDIDNDTDKDDDELDNIYEEVLNDKSSRNKQNHIRLSIKSSPSFGKQIQNNQPQDCHKHQVKKKQLSRTSVYQGPSPRILGSDIGDKAADKWVDSDKRDLRKEKRFLYIKKTLSEKLSRLALNH